jgi:hypothetical protein
MEVGSLESQKTPSALFLYKKRPVPPDFLLLDGRVVNLLLPLACANTLIRVGVGTVSEKELCVGFL